MEDHEEPGRPVDETSGTPAERPADPYAERFAGIVRALELQDPKFLRRVRTPPSSAMALGDLMIVIGLVVTVLFGVLPLALGLQAGVVSLLVAGALGCLVLPVVAPLTVRAIVRRVRPARS